MAIAAVFGHRDYSYYEYRDKLRVIFADLVQNHGVTEFFNGGRGDFDRLCGVLVNELKDTYPIQNTLILSYPPDKNFVLPSYFDSSLYLLEEKVPVKFAISHTNRKMVELADFIVSGTYFGFGGAWEACDYARRCKKKIINIFD